jgi:hypothetical protein
MKQDKVVEIYEKEGKLENNKNKTILRIRREIPIHRNHSKKSLISKFLNYLLLIF